MNKGTVMTQRMFYILSFLTVVVILGTGVYLEVVEGIMPCPLCTLQRICFGACGLLAFAGIWLYRKRMANIILNLFTMIFATMGMLLAGRQLWIQYYTSSSASDCGVSINYMLSVLPLQDVVSRIFSGSTECSQRGWEFLRLNIPEWSLIFFIAFLVAGTYYFFRGYTRHAK